MKVEIEASVKEKDVLEMILKKMAEEVKAGKTCAVMSKDEFLSGVPGKTAKIRVKEILKDYDYVFYVEAGSYNGDANDVKKQMLEFFSQSFGAKPDVNILKVNENYTVFCPVAFKITYFDQSK